MCPVQRISSAAVTAAVCLLAVAAPAAEKTPRPRRIAILPLQNLRPDTDTDWIGTGAAETLTTKLGSLPQLIAVERSQIKKVIDEHRFQAALGDAGTAKKVGQLVGVERVLCGTHVKDGDTILFNVRVVDVATGKILNRASLQASRRKVFDALFQLADAVIKSFEKKVVIVDQRAAVTDAAKAERIEITDAQRSQLKRQGTTNPDAYEAYARGISAVAINEKIKWYDQAIRLDPRYALAYSARAVENYNRWRVDEAMRDISTAVRLDPNDAVAYSRRAVILSAVQRFAEAVQDARRAVALMPHSPFVLNNAGAVYADMKDFANAIRRYTRAIELDPRDGFSYISRGNAYNSLGQYDTGIGDFTKAIQLEARMPRAYVGRGTSYYHKADYDSAIRDYDAAVKLDPSYATAYEHRAFSLHKKGQYAAAWRDVQACIRLGGKIDAVFVSTVRRAATGQ